MRTCSSLERTTSRARGQSSLREWSASCAAERQRGWRRYLRSHGAIFGGLLQQLLACLPRRQVSQGCASQENVAYRKAWWWVRAGECSVERKLAALELVDARASSRRRRQRPKLGKSYLIAFHASLNKATTAALGAHKVHNGTHEGTLLLCYIGLVASYSLSIVQQIVAWHNHAITPKQ